MSRSSDILDKLDAGYTAFKDFISVQGSIPERGLEPLDALWDAVNSVSDYLESMPKIDTAADAEALKASVEKTMQEFATHRPYQQFLGKHVEVWARGMTAQGTLAAVADGLLVLERKDSTIMIAIAQIVAVEHAKEVMPVPVEPPSARNNELHETEEEARERKRAFHAAIGVPLEYLQGGNSD